MRPENIEKPFTTVLDMVVVAPQELMVDKSVYSAGFSKGPVGSAGKSGPDCSQSDK